MKKENPAAAKEAPKKGRSIMTKPKGLKLLRLVKRARVRIG